MRVRATRGIMDGVTYEACVIVGLGGTPELIIHGLRFRPADWVEHGLVIAEAEPDEIFALDRGGYSIPRVP